MTRSFIHIALLATLVLAGVPSGQVGARSSEFAESDPAQFGKVEPRIGRIRQIKAELRAEPWADREGSSMAGGAGLQYTLFIDGHERSFGNECYLFASEPTRAADHY